MTNLPPRPAPITPPPAATAVRAPLPMPAAPPKPLAMPLMSPQPIARWGSQIERVRRLRIMVAIWAYAYEMRDHIVVHDGAFDAACSEVARDLHIDTDRPVMDKWFRTEFNPSTGMWIHHHPELGKVAAAYDRHFTKTNRR